MAVQEVVKPITAKKTLRRGWFKKLHRMFFHALGNKILLFVFASEFNSQTNVVKTPECKEEAVKC